jgi:Tol biopolymer transport system component
VQGQGGDVFLAPAAGGSAAKLVERGSYPAWSPDGQSVAFQSDRSGRWDIWTVPAKGGEPRPLTSDEDIDFQPSWSPDGRWIAYASVKAQQVGRLMVVRSDGSGTPRAIDVPAGLVMSPAWSPDGAWIHFASGRAVSEATTSLARVSFTERPEGKPRVERLTLGASADVDPDLAASGRRLAFAGVRYAPDLWEIEPASGALRQLTTAGCLEDYPHLSPDGRTLVFFSDRSGDTRLYTVALAGGDWQPFTAETGAEMPRWSPDGKTVAYVRLYGDKVTLALQPADGLTAREIVSLSRPASIQGPDWAPDGRSLAYTGLTADGRAALRVVDVAGRSREVLAQQGRVMFPSWSPDGRRIAFQFEKDGPRQIWVVDAQGGPMRPVSQGNTRELSHPRWSPSDPDRILVVVDHKNLALLSVATGALTPLTHYDDATRYVDYPSWSFDGRRAYFSMTLKVGDLFLLENRGQ